MIDCDGSSLGGYYVWWGGKNQVVCIFCFSGEGSTSIAGAPWRRFEEEKKEGENPPIAFETALTPRVVERTMRGPSPRN